MVLAVVAVVALVGAIGGLSLARFYDTQLVRQTESELLAQGAVLAEVFADHIEARVAEPSTHGIAAQVERPRAADPTLIPLLPTLRATDPVLPAPLPPPTASTTAEPVAHDAALAMASLLAEVSRTTLAGLRLVDLNGVVLASSEGHQVGHSIENRVEFQRALRGEVVSVLRERPKESADSTLSSLSRSNAIRVVVAIPVVRHGRVWGVVMLLRTPMTLAKAVYGDRYVLGVTTLVLLAVLSVVIVGLSIVIVGPVGALVRQTRAIASGDATFAKAIARPLVAELAELSTSLASMAELLDQRAKYIQGFTSSVSHEFKTPLAAIRGAIELLTDEHDALGPEQRKKFLLNVRADTDRMTRLVERLLLLARADVGVATATTCEVQKVLQGLEQPRVSVSCEPGLWALIPADALTAALSHLVENGLSHAGPLATVSVHAVANETDIRIEVTDDGPGISEANRGRIFEPFFTTARETGGTGLGLPIALALVRTFGGAVVLNPSSVGAHFTVRLKASRPPIEERKNGP
jgi:signal transduction histidine kinase/type II secretory pathway pseudopilin PulG